MTLWGPIATLGGGSGGKDLESSNRSWAASVSAAERSLNIEGTWLETTLQVDPTLKSGVE